MRFRSYVDGSERFMGPETSMEVQAALGSDIALAFDECTPFHVERDYTARSMERTHRWLDRCVDWQRATRARRAAALRDRPGRRVRGPAARVGRAESPTSDVDGVAVGGSLGQEKEQMREVVDWSLGRCRDEQPRHLLGIGDVDDILACGRRRHRHVRLRHAHPPRPPRNRARARPRARWRLDLTKAALRDSREPIAADCPCPACREHTRGYLHYLVGANELTGRRLLTLHNLTFMALLMEQIREAIASGGLAEYRSSVIAGERPFGESHT